MFMEKKPRCPDEALRRVPTYVEVREYVLKASMEPISLPKSVGKKALVRYTARLDKVSNYFTKNVMEPLKSLRDALQVGFYKSIASNALPEGVSIDDLVGRLLGKLKKVKDLSREYRTKISASFDSAEAGELYREYVGRVLSIARRLSKEIELANKAIAELRKTPCIDPSLPVVAVAGLPQVGKSTLVSAISSAKPKSSPFPFTTKEIILGHVSYGFSRFQILDLPGILDRPPEKMNEIERKAFIAITRLANLILFLIDPSEDFYYGLESQLNLLRFFKEQLKVGIVVAINKVDKVGPERLEKIATAIAEVAPSTEIVKISALERVGLEELLETLAKHLGRLSDLK
jgi:nucleolar GTP-binding protein